MGEFVSDKTVSNKVGGWKTKSIETVYENPWIKVTHEEVVTPGDTDGIYGVVHFKNTAVGVIPVDEQGNTWLVRQSRYTMNAYTWEIPEGGSPSGESSLETAARELQEEVGLKADKIEQILTMHLSNSVSNEEAHVFVATGLTHCEQALEVTEDIEVRKLSLDEAYIMVERGEITDAMSVAGLLKLQLTNQK